MNGVLCLFEATSLLNAICTLLPEAGSLSCEGKSCTSIYTRTYLFTQKVDRQDHKQCVGVQYYGTNSCIDYRPHMR
jgi:hypothetical protein